MTCVPRVRSDHWSGEVQELYAVPSSAHSNVRFSGAVRLSLPVNSKVATLSRRRPPAGSDVIVVFGPMMSGPSSTFQT